MDATQLRALQAPIKERYKQEPTAGRVTLRARGNLGEGLTCKVETGRALAVAGLHPATGGTGLELCSGDMLLEALVACAGVTLNSVATAFGIDVRSGRVEAEGVIDFRGTLGVDRDASVGFERILVTFQLDTDATPEQLDKLLSVTERYCVVLQTIRKDVPAAAEIVRS